MTPGVRDGHSTFRLGLEAVVGVNQELQLPILFFAQLVSKCFQIRLDFGDVRAHRAFRMSPSWFAPIKICEIAWIGNDGFKCSAVVHVSMFLLKNVCE